MQHRFIPLYGIDQGTMMQQQIATPEIDPIPDEISSSEAKLVYLYLEAAGGATVDDLSGTLALKKISILSVLNSLRTSSLVEKSGDNFVPA